MAQVGSSPSKGLHDAAPKDAPVSADYVPRPYSEAITAEHREALAASAPAPAKRAKAKRATTGQVRRPRRAKATSTTSSPGAAAVVAAVKAEDAPSS